jgi:nucleotide-binding universal stress UspA family protein
MFKKVLVGVDGEGGGRDALALARQLVAPDGELQQAHVQLSYPGTLSAIPTGLAADTEAEHAENEPPRVESVVSRSVGRGLHLLAEREGSDLLVVGSTRHGIFGRVLMGDDTQESISGSPCAVAVAPAGYADHPSEIKRVAVGYNESPESEYALRTARGIASEHAAKLSAIEVVSLPAFVYSARGPVPIQEMAKPLLEEARERMQALDGIETEVELGYPDEELTRHSRNVDLMIIGSRGYGPLGRLVHSSVSRHLARTAHCPLLVLTRGAEQQTGAD